MRVRRPRNFESASGLRPASAFVLVAFVLLAVSGKALYIALLRAGGQPEPTRSGEAPWPEFEITDRAGRPMALSVDSFDLSISPQSMWLSHTPWRIAERLSEHLCLDVPELLTRMLDLPERSSGWVLVEAPRLLSFSEAEALRVERWLRTGDVGDGSARPGRPIEGIQLARIDEEEWTLAWAPQQVLSEATRRVHLGPDQATRPDIWTRRLLRDLRAFVDLERLPDDPSEHIADGERSVTDEEIRAAIWAELMPSRFRVVKRGIDPITAHTIELILKEEAVSPWQMRMASGLARRSPVRPTADASVREARGAFDVVGRWGVLGSDDAWAQAAREVPGSEEDIAERARELETQWQPRSGLELLCARELAQPYWDGLLDRGNRSYDRRLRILPRDRRLAWDGEIPDYFLGADDAPDVPRFVSTVDAELQQLVHAELRNARDEHDAALVMAIVIEVESGAVLAVDAIHHYATSGFAPLQHVFTPGSTFKAVVMAAALDLGLVTPDEQFATFADEGLVITDEAGHSRHIHEALGAPEEPLVTAETGLAESVNAVLVQIGLRIPAPVFHERIVRLGYGAAPGANLGPESAGRVPPLEPLEKGGWKPCYTHASVSFGHEIGVTLWQHGTALATIARGGVLRPLHVIDRVEQGERAWRLPRADDERVFSAETCQSVRRMMATAAEFGTGRNVASAAVCPEFSYLGTKTGTTEKVESELCLHVELAHNATRHADGSPCRKACRVTLEGLRDHHGRRNTCYTSSMCAVGRVAGSDRELLVLLVVDGPRGKAKYGADVAGRSAIAILRGAFGLAPVTGALAQAAAPLPPRAFNPHDLPWAEASAR